MYVIRGVTLRVFRGIMPICGSQGAEVPAPGPRRAAAQRPSLCLREPTAWQRLWLIPPAPAGFWRLWNRGLGAASGTNARIGFTAKPASGNNAADEREGLISGEEPFAYHPKMGRYADLHNHLLGHIMRIGIFIALVALVLTLTTLTSSHGGLAFGSHSFEVYGWPQPWLHLDGTYKKAAVRTEGSVTETLAIDANGKPEIERTSGYRIDRSPLVVSAAAAGAITAVFLVPVFLWPRISSERGGPTKIEPMTRSAVTSSFQSVAAGALLVIAHPPR